MELTLYTHPMSRGRIARWMLEEIGQPYTVHPLAYGDAMKDAAYRAINPMGKVPALIHGDTVVTECAAICAYLADTFPQAGLAPTAGERGAYLRWLFFAAGPLEACVSNRSLGIEIPEEKRRMIGYGSYETVVEALDGLLSERAYVAGERFTAADVYVGSQVAWGMMFGTLERRPAFEAYAARLMQRDAAKRAQALDDALAEEMQPKA
ncbi:glutathione S-transferase family protein [Rhizobium sp. SAFR-030]|uniref:glutathione S-transferase family protein n=1 Tax=Rhizobium sp. SAFR-030 TaxID=3387277 RepID=UPI003F823E81